MIEWLMLAGVGLVFAATLGRPKGPPAVATQGPTLWRSLPFVASPHRSPRNGAEVGAIVIHYTAGSTGAVKWFQDRESLASAHFVVNRQGGVTQCVPLDHASWHAGAAELPNGATNVNARTIGIEIENWGRSDVAKPGYVSKILTLKNGTKIDAWWEPYPDAQVDAVAWLVRELKRDFATIKAVLGHEEIARPIGRKTDPGPLFPWARINGGLFA